MCYRKKCTICQDRILCDFSDLHLLLNDPYLIDHCMGVNAKLKDPFFSLKYKLSSVITSAQSIKMS